MKDLIKYLIINKKIEIEKTNENNETKRYRSAFCRMFDNHLDFFIPSENSKKVEFSANEEIKFLIYTKDGIFSFKTKVLSVSKKLMKVQKPKIIKRTQRRAMYREKLDIKINFVINDNIICEDIINISGSGISFNTNEDLRGMEKIDISFEIEGKKIKTPIEIIEIRKNLKNPKYYRISAKFIALNNYEREYIISNCIRQQIKNI